MRLTLRELDKLVIYQTGSLAQRRLARGLQLNLTEANALIAFQLQELIRDGKHSVSELMQLGKEILSRRHVLPGVSALMHDVQVEGTFPDGYVQQFNLFSSYSEFHTVAYSWSLCMTLFVRMTSTLREPSMVPSFLYRQTTCFPWLPQKIIRGKPPLARW
jgi:urease gamma subunit